MLTFVEAGTAFAADLGYGGDDFFSALENMLSRALNVLGRSSEDLRQSVQARLARLATSARDLGLGYGDFVVEAVSDVVGSDE
jgi:hypothetical protein